MRKIAIITAFLMALPVAAPVHAQSQGMPDARSGTDYNNSYRPGNRPSRQRFVCVMDRGASARSASCPASPGRVGGRCRCSGVVGNGTLQTY